MLSLGWLLVVVDNSNDIVHNRLCQLYLQQGEQMNIEERKKVAARLQRPKHPTIQQIADEAGVAAGTVTRLRDGHIVTSANAAAIVRALDVLEGDV